MGWDRVEHPATGGATLTVYHRTGEAFWAPIAIAFRKEQLPGLERVDSAQTARVLRGRVGPGGTLCYFKQYLRRNRLDPIKNIFRASRARRALLSETLCAETGFHCPRSVCLMEEYRAGLLHFCALVTEGIENAPSARAWLTQPALGVAADRSRKRAFLRAFAAEVGRWHAAGLYHGDLRLGNVIAQAANDGYAFYWLDNERNRRYTALPFRRRVHNLMQINYEPVPGLTLADRLYFWRSYLSHAALPHDEQQAVLRAVIRKTQKRWRKRGWI